MSRKDDYREEDIVFAMVTGYPWWPGVVTERHSKKSFKVTFFGDFSYADLGAKQIKPFARGLEKADLSNKELVEAIESAKRVVQGLATLEEEHMRVKEGLRRGRKTRPIAKKKKLSRRLTRMRRPGLGVGERTAKTRARRRMKAREKEELASQSMIQDPTHKRRSQKRREARLGKSMDQRLLEDSGQESECARVLEALDEEDARAKAPATKAKQRGKRQARGKLKKLSEKANTPKKQANDKPKEKEAPQIEESGVEEETEQEGPKKETEAKGQDQAGAEKERANPESAQKKQPKAEPNEAEAKQKHDQEANAAEPKLDARAESGDQGENLKEKFSGFEQELLGLLREMQSNQPIPQIEEHLKEWFQQISQIERFSPIVSTDIGKLLSKMSQICLERLNEKQVYTKILGSIEHLKNFIINKISRNFFESENPGEADSRLLNEDSITTTKRNDSGLAPDFGERAPVQRHIRLRIRKKMAKMISRLAARDSISKKTCLMLGARIEEFLHAESRGADAAFRAHTVRLLEFMEKSSRRFLEEFIFQGDRKCDVQVLRAKILELLRS